MTKSGSPTDSVREKRLPPAVPDHLLLCQIGAGAYGEVWLARNAIGTLRAVKLVWRANFNSDRPYEREFKGMLTFEPISRSHEGFVDILQIGRNDQAGYFYYVMELADDAAEPAAELAGQPAAGDAGGPGRNYRPRTLSSETRKVGRLSAADCLRHFLTLTNALDALHRAGLIHRDIKPSNIILVGGVAKLADIGLVTAVDSERSFVGTEGFIPPEGPGTIQADIYSLGKVLYEVATGNDRMEFPSLPYDPQTGRTDEELLELNAVLTRACLADARERYQSAAQMHADLALLQSGRSVKQIRVVQRQLKFALRAGQVATLLALVGFLLAYFYLRQSRNERESLRRSEELRHEREQALVEANLARASAERLSGRVGRRQAALSALTQAVALNGPSEALRSEAVAALALTDLTAEPEIPGPDIVSTVQHALSPGMDLRALTTTNGDLRILRVSDNSQVGRLPGVGRRDRWVGPFSPDGRLLAVYNGFQDVVVRAVADGRELLRVPHEPAWESESDPGWWVARGFSPDSRYFAVVHGDTRLTVYDLAGGGSRDFKLPAMANTLAWRPDGRTLALCNHARTNQIMLLNTDLGTVQTVSLPTARQIYALAWDPRGLHLAAGGGDARIYVLATSRTNAVWRELQGHQQHTVALAYHPGGRLLVSSGWDNTTRLWNVTTGREVAQMPRWGWDFIFSADGRRLSFYDAESGAIKLFSVTDQAVCREIQNGSDESLNQVVFAPDSSWIGLAGESGLRFFDAWQGNLLAVLSGETPGAVLVKNPGTNDFALITAGLHHLEQRRLNRTASGAWQFGSPSEMAASGTGPLLDSMGGETYGCLQPGSGVWVGTTAGTPRLLAASEPFRRVVLSPDGKLAASTGYLPSGEKGRHLIAWNTATGKIIWHQPSKGRGPLAFAPDSRRLGATSDDGVSVWDVPENRLIWRRPKTGDANSRDSLAWSPDGRLLAVTFTMFQTGLIDAGTGAVITRMEHPEPSLITMLNFSPDGGQLAVGCDSGRVQLWNLRELRRELAGLKLDWNLPPITPLAAGLASPRIQMVAAAP